MPSSVDPLPAQLPPYLRRKLSADHCQALHSADLVNYEIHELFDGCLVRKARKPPLHSCLLHPLVAWLGTIITLEFVEQGATEDRDPYNQLAPDAFVLNKPFRAFPFKHPTPADIRLTSLLP